MKYSRKSFLKLLSLGGVALAGPSLASSNPTGTPKQSKQRATRLQLGLTSYTTRKYSLEETIEMTQRLRLEKICLKSMHMPLDSSEKDLQKIADQVKQAGLTLYGAGVVYMKSEEEVHNAFRFAKAAGLQTMTGVPNHELLPLVDQKVKETDIKLAIHNHGPGDEVYPTPKVIYEKIKSLDQRIGLCIDVGHIQRLNMDPIKDLKTYANRLYDIHLKDVSESTAKGFTVPLGTGVIDILGVFRALNDIGYQGVMALEYEREADDVLPGLAECVGYANGVMDMLA